MPPKPERPAASRASRLLPILVAGAALATAACSTQRVAPSSSEMGGMGPLLTVERFLQAVNSRDYEAMANLFGTADGPIEGDRTEIERRMDLMARVLAHEDYDIASERRVAGRRNPATRVGVNLTISRETVPDVGFVVVQSGEGGWLVEEIELEKVTSR